MANPASENYVKQGVKLVMKERGEMGDFGVCYFEDNSQCEEWAPFRGECPVGGLKVTGYITEAARFYAITGGEYAIIGNSGADNEQGTVRSRPACLATCWNTTTASAARTSNPLVDILYSRWGIACHHRSISASLGRDNEKPPGNTGGFVTLCPHGD